FASHELDQEAALLASPASRTNGAAATNIVSASSGSPTSYVPAHNDACSESFGSNVKINQNCLNVSDPDLQGRGQAQNETAIAEDPNNPNHLVAAFNDYR